MLNYCKCEKVLSSYKSYAKNICCSDCFCVIENTGVKVFRVSMTLTEDSDNYMIKNHGFIVSAFNKFSDDFAATNAKRRFRHLTCN